MDEFRLRPMRETDLAMVLAWRNSARVRNAMFKRHTIGWEEHCAWFRRCAGSAKIRNFIFWMNEKPLGVVSVTDIDLVEGNCSWGVYIGDEEAPRGAGHRMGQAAIDYIFHTLKLRRIQVKVLADNLVSLKFHQKLGFKKVLSQDKKSDGAEVLLLEQ